MDTQLKRALELHKQGDEKGALNLYEQLLKTEQPPLISFLNASSIWRSQEQQELSIACLKKGLTIYPNEAGLWNNLGNCHLDTNNITIAISNYRRALTLQSDFVDSRISLASCLREIGHVNLAYAVIKCRYSKISDTEERQRLLIPLVEAILALTSRNDERFKPENIEAFLELVECEVHEQVGEDDPCRAGLLLTQLWLQVDHLDRALISRKKLIKDANLFFRQPGKSHLKLKNTFHNSWNALSWNLGINLLKKGRFKDGWNLFEYGLRVPAPGPQRWQRSLKKPFTPTEVPFWRGESLKGKRLLLLGEQGIGDSMMFASLIPRLLSEGAEISLLPGDRLISIYKRSLPNVTVLTSEDLLKGVRNESDFDLQSPLGSICQYRFHELNDYGPCNSILKADPIQTAQLRQRYSDGRPLVGISWQGGGKANRIAMKSLKLKQLTSLLQNTEYRFVSLQYGDDGPHLERYRQTSGVEIVHDDSIDPLRDMDGWLSQVAAMDAVISIANTTVHGAGGLGIPTLCLVSQQRDWRWIDPEIHKGCYWYPSVDALYQDNESNWQPALSEAVNWMKKNLSEPLVA